ncbi:MAG: DNA-processing protein DprA [Isosphaeraceae bacterium]|nr:DNA-processing protein DprA [Isosphaeraceae bacterium]
MATDPAADDAVRDLLRLTLIKGVGPQTCRALLEAFGDAGSVLAASASKLERVQGVGPKLADAVARARDSVDVERELKLTRDAGVEIIARGTPRYPGPLENIPDPPSLIYVKGTLVPGDELAIALVGSRKCTPYGLRSAHRLASSLGRIGLCVVSGLARGIDAEAHRGALEVGGRTIAVMANGLGEVYPPEHADLAADIEQSGAIISEMPMTQGPLAGLFPQRNRIIAGLSLGVVVVEATPKSGSLSTAKHAEEQNREVFAVPGPIDSLPSRGCHRLIRDGAKLVETVEDIVDELGPLVRAVKPSPAEPAVRRPIELTLSDLERSVLGRLDQRPLGVDELVQITGMTASQVMATLSVLEMRRLVRRLPGHLFVRA